MQAAEHASRRQARVEWERPQLSGKIKQIVKMCVFLRKAKRKNWAYKPIGGK